MTTTWATQYKNAPADTLERWVYYAACYITHRVGESEQHEKAARSVGAYAFEHGCGIWHACWRVLQHSQGECYCSPCRQGSPAEIA